MNNNFGNVPSFHGNNIMTDFNNQSYLDNILKLNHGKKVEIYMSFSNHQNQDSRVFKGIIEETGKDHIVLSDPSSGNWYLLLLSYIDFIKFDEKINTDGKFYPTI